MSIVPRRPGGVLGTRAPAGRCEERHSGGGILPSIRPHYPTHVAKALHALAESNPTPTEYKHRKEAILAHAPKATVTKMPLSRLVEEPCPT